MPPPPVNPDDIRKKPKPEQPKRGRGRPKQFDASMHLFLNASELRRIDAVRGDESKADFIRRAISEALGRAERAGKKGGA